MEITRALNLAITIDGKDGPIHVHATPLPEATFRRHFMLIAKIYATITEERLHTAGPRIAALLARRKAEEMDEPALADAFLSELRRTTSVFIHQPETGYLPVPLQVAVDRGAMDEEGVSEVENLLAFFTSFSAMLPRKLQPGFAEGVASACNGHTTSSTSMEYAASLQR